MKKYSVSIIACSVVMASLAGLPFSVMAKDGNVSSKSQKQASSWLSEVSNSLNNAGKGIGSAWGHLIAPGWLKNFGSRQTESGDDSQGMPPGIAKHLNNGEDSGQDDNEGDDNNGDHDSRDDSGGGTTTPPTNPLVLSGLVAVAGQNQAEISWNTNRAGTSNIWYGTTTPVDVLANPNFSRNSLVFNHFAALNGLSASTTYHFVVRSTDSSGRSATSSESTFTTAPGPYVNPLSITSAVAVVGSSSVKLMWNTTVAADSEAYFSTSSPVTIGASSTAAVIDSALVNNHSLTASNLSTSTAYYFLIRSENPAGDVISTGQFSVVTGI